MLHFLRHLGVRGLEAGECVLLIKAIKVSHKSEVASVLKRDCITEEKLTGTRRPICSGSKTWSARSLIGRESNVERNVLVKESSDMMCEGF